MIRRNLLFTLFAFHVFLVFSQQKASVIVRFRSEFIYLPVTENKREMSYQLKDILNSDGMKLLEEMAPDAFVSSKTKVVKLFPNLSWKDSLSVTRFGDVISTPPFWATFLLECKAEDVSKTLSYLNSQQQLVLYAEMPVEAELQSYPDDLFYPEQYSLVYNPGLPNAGINVEDAWEIETGKPFVKIGVLDSGIDSLHPDLEVLYGGAYYRSDDPPVWGVGVENHGSLVAGIIGAKRNNGIGIAGIAGGDGTDSSGISLIDLRFPFATNSSPNYLLAATVDGARSVGSYWAYPENYYHAPDGAGQYPYFASAPGFGLYVQNHSYIMKATIPAHIEGKELPVATLEAGECILCREAFLFSLKSGVINVVARGNSTSVPANDVTGEIDPETVEGLYPQSFPDNWLISVGASGYDGNTVEGGVNQGYRDSLDHYYSLYGGNMDLIAPGSDSIVKSTGVYGSSEPYRWFNGTSSAAPHVSGVVGLLLSNYDRDCYSKRNLTIEDVEYILEHSATDVMAPGEDVISAHGRLNAYEALKMIDFPKKQIVHPQEVTSSSVTAIDTIRLHYNYAYSSENWGPLSRNFPLSNNFYYQVEVVKWQNTYAFDDYLTPATEILEIYSLPSRSNALRLHHDTLDLSGESIGYDKFDVSPYCEIVGIDSALGLVTTQGYYYHFIGRQSSETNFEINVGFPVDFWYPINPYVDYAKLPISIYLSDSTLTGIYDLPCDSVNLAYDVFLDLPDQEDQAFEVYPNPSKGIYTVRFTENGNYKIKVVDLTGRTLKEMTTGKKELTFDLTSEPNGTFILILESDQRQFHRKIVKL